MVALMAEETKLLNVTQAAKRLGIHPNTLRQWADRDRIPSIRLVSGVRRFDPEVIERVRRESGMGDSERSAPDV